MFFINLVITIPHGKGVFRCVPTYPKVIYCPTRKTIFSNCCVIKVTGSGFSGYLNTTNVSSTFCKPVSNRPVKSVVNYVRGWIIHYSCFLCLTINHFFGFLINEFLYGMWFNVITTVWESLVCSSHGHWTVSWFSFFFRTRKRTNTVCFVNSSIFYLRSNSKWGCKLNNFIITSFATYLLEGF